MDSDEYRARIARAMTEKTLQERVRQMLTLFGWRHYHTFRATNSPAGFPDECAVRGYRLIFAELKTERGKTSPAQDEWLADLRRIADDTPRVEVYLWRPTDLLDGTIEAVLS